MPGLDLAAPAGLVVTVEEVRVVLHPSVGHPPELTLEGEADIGWPVVEVVVGSGPDLKLTRNVQLKITSYKHLAYFFCNKGNQLKII